MKTLSNIDHCLYIKNMLQTLSGVEDIGFNSRKAYRIDLKFTYYNLCRKFTNASLELMAQVLGNYDHSSAIHGLKTFENRISAKDLKCLDIYEAALKTLTEQRNLKLKILELSEEAPSTIPELNRKYLISLINISEKGHSIIKRKQKRIDELKTIIFEILERTDPANPRERNDLQKYYLLRTAVKTNISK